MIVVREAEPHDAPDMARVILSTARTTYKGLLPDDVLAAQRADDLASYWREHQGDEHGICLSFVAVDEQGDAVGIAWVIKPGEQLPGYEYQLEVLYVLDAYQGQGVGRGLIRAVADHLAARGAGALTVSVLAANGRARRFYEALGAVLVRERPAVFLGVEVDWCIYGWPDIAALRSRVGTPPQSPE